jgi:ribonuclease HI
MEWDGREGVVDRKLMLCPETALLPPDKLIQKCDHCNRFYLRCCACVCLFRKPTAKMCHHFQVIFTSGCCLNNGKPDATSGMGIMLSSDDRNKISIPITNLIDTFAQRSNRRAEIMAAIQGVELGIADAKDADMRHIAAQPPDCPLLELVVATDSNYVVQGITEWLPVWKVSKPRVFRMYFNGLLEERHANFERREAGKLGPVS